MNIEKTFMKFNTEDIMSSIIEMQLCPNSEIEDIKIPIAEVLSSNLVKYNTNNSKEIYTWGDFQELQKLGKNLIMSPIGDIFGEALKLKDADDDIKLNYLKTLGMKLKHGYSRGDAYLHQLINFANLLYSPFDKEFNEKLGFTYTCCEKVFIYILKKYCNQTSKAFKRKHNFFNFIKNTWDYFIKGVPLINPSISNSYIYRVTKEELYNHFNKEEIDNIVKALSLQSGDDSIKPTNIGDFNPLFEKPIVDFGSYIYLPIPQSTIMNLPKLFHYTFIAKKIFDNETIAKYKKHRGDVVESLTQKYMKNFFNKESIYNSLKYPPKKKTYEADVTVQDSDISIFCECKSKILTLPTLKGDSESLKKDINQAIKIAYEQAIRSIKWLQNNKAFVIELSDKDVEIHLSKTKYYFVLCVTAENFGFVPFDIYNYIEIDNDIPIIPIVINIYDLEIVSKECSDREEFINYLLFRLRNYKLISSYDELDILGLYKRKGNVKLVVSADELFVSNYTNNFDKKYYLKSIKWLMTYDTSYYIK